MLHARRALYDISLVNDSSWLSPFLIVASAFCDEQNLTAWMNMPIQLCTRIVGCLSNAWVERAVSYIQLVQPDVSRVVFICG